MTFQTVRDAFRVAGAMATALLLVCLCESTAWAQVTSTISGAVSDTTGAVIRGAAVTLTNQTTGVLRTATTDDGGRYRFENLAAGGYELTVASQGFESAIRTVSLTADPATMDITLGVGGLASTISVVGSARTATDVAGRSTASRLNIPNTDLPVQVSSVSPQVLQSQGVPDVITAMRNVSGASAFRGYGMYEYENIRGFAGSTAVNARMVDGMRLEGNRLNSQIVGVEQIDVLKGPSALLYGNSTLGGAVNVILKKPEPVPSYDLFYRAGSFNTHQVGVGSTGAVFGAERLLYRFDIGYENSDGWRDAGARRLYLSPTFTWLVNDQNRVVVRQGIMRDNFDGDAGVPLAVTTLPGYEGSWRFNTPQDFAAFRESRTQVMWNATLSNSLQFRNSFFYQYGNDEYFTAESLAYRPQTNAVDRTFLYFKHHRRPVLNQTDLTGTFNVAGIANRFLVGYEFQRFHNFSNRSASRSVATTPLSLATFNDTHVFVPDFPLSRIDYFTNLTNAIFWQDQIEVTSRLKINVGGRFEDYRRMARNDPFVDGVPQGLGVEQRRHQNPFTYRAGLVFGLSANQQAYASSASTFRPVTVVPADGRELEPESGRSFEVGHRWQGLNGMLDVNTAVYRIVLRDVVVARGNQIFDQAGQQSSKGIDIDVNGNVTSDLRITANYGYTVPRYDEFFASNGTVNLSGNQPRMTQRHAANLWVTRNWRSGLSTSAGVRYLSAIYNDDLNTVRLPPFTLVNAAIGYQQGNYQLTLNADNLLNRKDYFHPQWITTQATPGQPFSLYATLRVRLR